MLNILIDPSKERKIADFRTLGLRGVMTLGRYSYAHAHRPLQKHSHGNMFEICLLDDGVQPYFVDGREIVLKGGEVLVTFPNEAHGTGPNPENRGRLYWLLVRVPAAKERFLNLPPGEGRRLIRKLLSLEPRHFRGNRRLKGYLESMFAAFDRKEDPFRTVEIENWALRFLLDLVRASREQPPRISPAMERVLQSVESRLFDPPPRLEDLARQAGLSLSRFKTRFKKEVGVAPGNYFLQRRIEKSKSLLRNTRRGITEIALDLGFASSQYFATAFRRYTGESPTAFRRRNP
jgi:AraC-like DNA-binding protein